MFFSDSWHGQRTKIHSLSSWLWQSGKVKLLFCCVPLCSNHTVIEIKRRRLASENTAAFYMENNASKPDPSDLNCRQDRCCRGPRVIWMRRRKWVVMLCRECSFHVVKSPLYHPSCTAVVLARANSIRMTIGADGMEQIDLELRAFTTVILQASEFWLPADMQWSYLTVQL